MRLSYLNQSMFYERRTDSDNADGGIRVVRTDRLHLCAESISD